jgi:hypothetical protein
MLQYDQDKKFKSEDIFSQSKVRQAAAVTTFPIGHTSIAWPF